MDSAPSPSAFWSRPWSHPGAHLLHRHPFAPFYDQQTTGLILGTFPGQQFTAPGYAVAEDDWYYGSRGNQLWPLLYQALAQPLPAAPSRSAKQALLQRYRLGMTDIVQQAYRIRATNQDHNLHVQAIRSLTAALAATPQLQRIYLTSKSMYREFFLPAYFAESLRRRPRRCGVIGGDSAVQAECYRYDHDDGRQITLILLPSPARVVKGLPAMQALYRTAFAATALDHIVQA